MRVVSCRLLVEGKRAGWDVYFRRGFAFLFELLGFVLGLLFGSFLNVCISRLPEHESIVTPRSRCMACGHTMRWYDNVPVLSWVVLRGRCRDCKAGISWRYPAVELAVGLWFAMRRAVLRYWLAHPSRDITPTARRCVFSDR